MDNQGQPGKHFVIIRKAIPSELDKVCTMHEYLNSCLRQNFDSTMKEGWSTSEQGRQYFEQRLNDANGLFLVAVDGDAFIGYLNAVIQPISIHRIEERVAVLENMMIVPELQKKNIGRKMFEIFVNWCREQTVSRISVTTYTKNTNALEFYRHMGMEDYTSTLEMVVPPSETAAVQVTDTPANE